MVPPAPPHLHLLATQPKLFARYCCSTTATATATATANQIITKFTLPSLVKHCASQLHRTHGRTLHAIALQMGLHADPFVASSLVTLYFKCGSPADAANVFEQLPHRRRDATIWNSMLNGYLLTAGMHNQSVTSLRAMQSSGAKPDRHSLTILLKGCADGRLSYDHGEQLHGYAVRNHLDSDHVLATALVDMYAKCGDVTRAFRAFDCSSRKSVSMWNAMIAGFCYDGLWARSLEMFVRMRRDGRCGMEAATVASVVTACADGEESAVGFGEGVHCCALKEGFELDPYVSTSLVTMYGKFGLIDDARRVFEGAREKRIELWNSLVSVCFSNDRPGEALDAYRRMRLSNVRCDAFVLSHVLSACTAMGLWDLGRGVHGHLIKLPELDSTAVQSCLTTMYMKGGGVDDAIMLFDSTKNRDVFVWSSIIAGYFQNKRFDLARRLFDQMRAEGLAPDSAIVASVASASAGMGCLELGCQIHGLSVKSGMSCDQFLGCALIEMYSKLGLPELAGSLYASMPRKNLVVFNSMIAGYGRNGLVDESIEVLCDISRHGLVPDAISITSALASASSSAALAKGKTVHGYQLRKGITSDILVENALLDMYMKCGCSSYSQIVFERMSYRNLISWNTMIAGYGSHGQCAKAMLLFDEMKSTEVLPDEITFLALLSSCNHSGSVGEGKETFESMRRDCGIVPRTEHYAIMVDMLARAGRLHEAYAFIQGMPGEPDEGVWLCLLSACRAYRDVHLGEVVADRILKAKPRGSGVYSQVSNFFGEMGWSDRAAGVRVEMREAGRKKNPGCSWVEVKDRVQMFRSGDSSSLLTTEIHSTLDDLRRSMRRAEEFFRH